MSTVLITALLEDRAGNLWLATDGSGLNRLRDGRFSLYTTRDGLPEYHVRALLEDRQGDIWIGTTVQIVSEGTAQTREQTTTSTGDFTFPDLPVGLYALTVTKTGFQIQKLQKVEVAVGKVTSLNVTLGMAQM